MTKEPPSPWYTWDPFVLSETITLAQALATIPPSPIQKMPLLVRILENPASPFPLAGPTSIFDHDCIHVVLGRGLLQQDEGFVIGYSVGNASDSSALDRLLFRDLSALYPKPYTFMDNDLISFDHGFDCGASSSLRDMHLFPFSECVNRTIGSVRKELALCRRQLRAWFREEVTLIPSSKASRRLRLHMA